MQSRPRVLLADDHPGVLKALERVLSLECDVVGVVADGNEVTAAAARLQPVVTVVDLNLPNLSGLEICRQIVQTNPRAKVFLMTVTIDDWLKSAALTAGAAGCFPKLEAGNTMIEAIQGAWAEGARG
jgi:DNA-binding NarL/FixJ family response regulator